MLETFIILSFCVYRLTNLLSQENGPFDIIIKFRKLLGKSAFGKLMDCFYCTSIWIALILAFIFVKDSFINTLMKGFALSGAAVAIYKLTTKNESDKNNN